MPGSCVTDARSSAAVPTGEGIVGGLTGSSGRLATLEKWLPWHRAQQRSRSGSFAQQQRIAGRLVGRVEAFQCEFRQSDVDRRAEHGCR